MTLKLHEAKGTDAPQVVRNNDLDAHGLFYEMFKLIDGVLQLPCSS